MFFSLTPVLITGLMNAPVPNLKDTEVETLRAFVQTAKFDIRLSTPLDVPVQNDTIFFPENIATIVKKDRIACLGYLLRVIRLGNASDAFHATTVAYQIADSDSGFGAWLLYYHSNRIDKYDIVERGKKRSQREVDVMIMQEKLDKLVKEKKNDKK